ncbi:MAG: DJ-1 family glyoxalase III [Fusicatenibacter sp.]|nr:DJ-1/PfpI family protein [Lachnospiraceae bacterium]MDY2938697.1 DJ-1 family glyoxalase III [Fusicatenibacter sp.]
MSKIYVFLADGCEEIEALTPVDLLRRAGEEVCTVSVMGRREVIGSHKITILADCTIEEGEFDDGDMLILPGGMPGTLNLGGCESLAALIRSYDDRGKRLAAICAAPSILGVMGILKGKKAVCFPGFEDKLAGSAVLEQAAVTDGNVTTGRGMGAAVDFSLELIRVLQGGEAAKKMGEKIVYHC